jgi:putative flavoprotein involved in K+ transport
MSGRPSRPQIPGMELFQGRQHHSAEHPGGAPYKGQRCVIVGANTSAHDIAADLVEQGAASVTMVQRSPTLIVKAETLTQGNSRLLYSEEALARGITTEKADLIVASWPYREMAEQSKPFWREVRRQDAELYRRLEAVGFQLDFGEDESGVYMKYVRRGAGFYFDVGACELVCDGRIALKSGGIERLTQHTVVLSDGTELPADLVVWATGYGPMHEWAAELISQDVAEKVGKIWGLGSDTTKDPGPWEGEQRNMWKPTRQEGLWFHGGNLHQSRHYSQFLALQLKARMEGIPTPIYGLAEVHHTA